MSKKKIVLAGAYGIQNAGDDAPMLVLKNAFDQLSDKNIEYTVIARHVLEFDMNMFDANIMKNIEYESREAASGKWFNGLNFGDKRQDITSISEKIKGSDLLVIGAGNAFIDISIDLFRGPIPLMAVYCFLADMYEVPIVFYGVSVGPIRTELGRDLSRWLLRKAKIVSVRDTQSINYIKDDLKLRQEIVLMPDPVLGLTSKPISTYSLNINLIESERDRGKRIIGVGLREIRSIVGDQERDRVFTELISFFKSNRDRYLPVFIPNSTYPEDDDRKIASELVEKLDDVVSISINDRIHPAEIISIYRLCDCTVSIRLHSAVFSIMASTPVLAISYLPKVSGFASNLSASAIALEIDKVSLVSMNENIDGLLELKNDCLSEISRFLDQSASALEKYFSSIFGLIGNKEQW